MTDDLEDLKKLMDAATPAPDADTKALNIALAQKNFADLQGSRDDLRPTSDRPRRGVFSGVRNMLDALNTRAGLTASTALIAVGLVVFTPIGQNLLNPGDLTEGGVRAVAPRDDGQQVIGGARQRKRCKSRLPRVRLILTR
ncbi:hypothetical protein [Sulfitobacter aestuariivivens]|uniref:hypothetical protein n=1 Tax=Sulfitobacter aestuariivivens TaxID=2766981 RepID=UPI003610F8B7